MYVNTESKPQRGNATIKIVVLWTQTAREGDIEPNHVRMRYRVDHGKSRI